MASLWLCGVFPRTGPTIRIRYVPGPGQTDFIKPSSARVTYACIVAFGSESFGATRGVPTSQIVPGKLKEHYQDKVSNLEEEWPDENHLKYRFKTFGFDIQGEAKVEPQTVLLNLTLPFTAMMFKGKIEQTLRDELTRLLG